MTYGAAARALTATAPSNTSDTNRVEWTQEGGTPSITTEGGVAVPEGGVAVPEEELTNEENIHDFTGSTQSVEDSHIVTNTRNTYNRTLIDIMIWLFTHLPSKLVCIEPLTAAKLIDDSKRTTKQREAKRDLRAACQEQLKRMNRIEKNSPIHISGPCRILYEDIAKFMGSKRKIVEVDPELANRLAAEEGASVLNSAGGRGKIKVAVRLSDSSYSAIQSGISFLYRQCGLERSTEIKEGMALYCKGSKRKGRKLKQSLGLVISEGKKPMSREVYSYLANKMFRSKNTEHIFSHLFLLLDW